MYKTRDIEDRRTDAWTAKDPQHILNTKKAVHFNKAELKIKANGVKDKQLML